MKILIVEDSSRLLRSLEKGLSKLGYAVDVAADGADGLAFAETYPYDAIVLDLMLPSLSGHDVIRELRRKNSETHILILSAKDQVSDRVKGLELGADDYLTKPFAFDELCARLQSLVRRRYAAKNPTLSVGSLQIDTARRTVSRDGADIALTPSEYRLLEFLAYSAGQVVSQDRLIHHLYTSDTDVSSNVIEVLVSSLRRKLHQPGTPSPVKTKRGFGYYVD
ncbi:MAG: response regulator [Alphaproteobacteria bacterium]|nr:response regulator [Alphaproteobacteria bacterium]